MEPEKRICVRCISDTNIPGIRFNESGVCKFCEIHDVLAKMFPLGEEGQQRLHQLAEKIRVGGKGQKYDCVVGVSGGTDSSYLLYICKKLGLRPLAVHLDNGWNTEIATSNIRKVVAILEVELRTVTCDREEFKDLQISFLKAGVHDAEIPTDIAIKSVLYQVAAEEGIGYVVVGHSFRVEGFSPIKWTHMDGRYIKSIHDRFGRTELQTFPNLTLSRMFYYAGLRRIRYVYLLPHIDYRKEEAKKILRKEFGWTDYGEHHYESTYTRFVSSYLLPKKFKIDKRIIEYSAYVRSGQMTRDEALEKIKEPLSEDKELVQYVIDKLGLTNAEFQDIMSAKPKTFLDYPTYYPFIRAMRFPIWVACKLNLLPHIFYEKYFNG